MYVSVDGVRIYEDAVEGGNSRGLHVVVLNQHTGSVMATRIFDTYAELLDEEIILFLKILQQGRIIIFMLKVGACLVVCRGLVTHKNQSLSGFMPKGGIYQL